MEFPDNVIAQLDRQGRRGNSRHALRATGLRRPIRWWIPARRNLTRQTPYYYSVYGSENEAKRAPVDDGRKCWCSVPARSVSDRESSSIICSVHCTWAFPKEGYETIIVNNNPETVSTDFDIADKLYFEPLTPEDVESIVDIEKPGRSCGTVRRTDRHQADREPDEDGRADSWNYCGERGCGGGPGALR